MPIFDLDNPATPATGIIASATGVTLGNIADGIEQFTEITTSGAQAALDFNLKPVLRINVTGALSGAYANPPTDVPTLPANTTEFVYVIEYTQDATGGHAIPLATLFANYAQEGVAAAANTTPDKPTLVFLIGRKSGAGVVTYSVSFPPAIAGEQITFGTIPVARIQAASTGAPGVIQIGTTGTAAAAGNHVHTVSDSKKFVVDKSDGSALTAGDYPILEDVNFTGVVTLWTKVQLLGGTTPTATVSMKINSTTITGTSLSATGTASGDGVATTGNRYALREGLYLNIASPTGSFTRVTGIVHIVKDGVVAA